MPVRSAACSKVRSGRSPSAGECGVDVKHIGVAARDYNPIEPRRESQSAGGNDRIGVFSTGRVREKIGRGDAGRVVARKVAGEDRLME